MKYKQGLVINSDFGDFATKVFVLEHASQQGYSCAVQNLSTMKLKSFRVSTQTPAAAVGSLCCVRRVCSS